MKDASALAACLAVAAATVLVAAPAARPRTPGFGLPRQERPQATFRSAASAVAVDATVRDRSRRAITGLEAGDFELFDNGVPQQVHNVSYGKLPIDVTIALDVSYSVSGDLLERLQRGVGQLMRDLGRDDRLKLVLFNMRVNRILDFTSDVKAVERAIRSAAPGGGTALLDAVSVTLVSASPPDRRQLIVFFTDGSDSSSTTSLPVLTVVAQRTRGTLTFVMPSASPSTAMQRSFTSVTVTMAAPPGGVASRSPVSALFATLAAETGGSLLPVDPTTDLTATFRTVLGEFRSTYVLYYMPRGVDTAGYHTLNVKVKREGAQVQARRGYFSS